MTGWEEEGKPDHRIWRHSDTGAKIEMRSDDNNYSVNASGSGISSTFHTSDLDKAWKKVNEHKMNFAYRKKKSNKSKSKRKTKGCGCK